MTTTLRSPISGDCRFAYECRNDDEARKNARETEEIAYSVHKDWFRKTIGEDSGVTLYVGEQDRVRTGVVRYTHGDPTEIAIHIHPSQRGQGHGTRLLRESIRSFTGENMGERELMATIRPSNLGSIRIFEKAGFVRTGEKDPKDDGFDVYMLDLEKKQ